MSRQRNPNRVFISLGSNIEAALNLPAAVRLLDGYGEVTAASTVYETRPVKFQDQANFLNAAVLLETGRDLDAAFGEIVPEIEHALHRVRDPANRNGPRTIDLDIVLFNDLVSRTHHHELPDPEIETRPFVGIPLAEIAPDYIHPVKQRSLAEIARDIPVEPGDMQPRPDVVLLAR